MKPFEAGDRIRVTYETIARQRPGDSEPWYFGEKFQGLGFGEVLSHKFEVVGDSTRTDIP